ncbi:MAG: hypothetical protein ACRDUV_10125 [Pseudonocardiaceae bacterium]
MALAGALCAVVHTITGFTNRSLCAQVSTLLRVPYTMNQMSYDLRRLRLEGLITRLSDPIPTSSPKRASESRSSTPSSTTGSCDHCSPPTTHPHR